MITKVRIHLILEFRVIFQRLITIEGTSSASSDNEPPSIVVVDADDGSVVHDIVSALDVFADWESRYAETPVSQADFFAPTELVQQDSGSRHNSLAESLTASGEDKLDTSLMRRTSIPTIILTPPVDSSVVGTVNKPDLEETNTETRVPEILEKNVSVPNNGNREGDHRSRDLARSSPTLGPRVAPPSASLTSTTRSSSESDRQKSLPTLKKARRLEDASTFQGDSSNGLHAGIKPIERRNTVVSHIPERKRSTSITTYAKPIPSVIPTPRPWATTDSWPKNGWRMRTRCSDVEIANHTVDFVVVYLYNSAMDDRLKYNDKETDLDLFEHKISVQKSESEFFPKPLGRATTDLGKQSQSARSGFNFRTPTHTRIGQATDLYKPSSRRTNWIRDHHMLGRNFPGSRIITIGFDVSPAVSVVPNIEMAAGQLSDYIQHKRKETCDVPLIFFGHTLGAIFVIQAMGKSTPATSGTTPIINRTAGLFAFSYPVPCTDARSRALAALYSVEPGERIFSDLSGTPQLERLSKSMRGLLSMQQPQNAEIKESSQIKTNPREIEGSIEISFPIIQFYSRNESQDFKGSLSNFLGVPVRKVSIEKELTHAVRFADAQDPDFLRIVMLARSALQTHQLLRAAAAGSVSEVEAMLSKGVNPNFRDRWSQTALQIAVRRNDEELVNVLLRADSIDSNSRDTKSNTPLHYAIRTGNESIIRNLIHHDADINIQNHRKQTPKDLAEKHKSRKHIAKMLRSRLVSGPDQSMLNKKIGTGTIPDSKEGRLACRSFQITITEIYAVEGSDKHWSVNVSVRALLYGSSSLDAILREVRPKEIESQIPICVWIHVPENNMIWIQDLFSKMKIHPAIWQESRQSITDSIRNRAITPHVGNDTCRSVFLSTLR